MALLTELQRIRTTGARAVATFVLDGVRWLAVPQLAADAAETPHGINGGSSDAVAAPVLLLREGPRLFRARISSDRLW